jgi:GrpB-like predicted nucleotidyltransferase (UPF0157 family)
VIYEYSKLKNDLRENYKNDRAGYTNAKAPFIKKIIERAMQERVKNSQ